MDHRDKGDALDADESAAAGSSAEAEAIRSERVAGWAGSRADHFRRGAAGERALAEAIAPLSANGWTILHDRASPGGGNVDHILVGPGGVVVLDAKAWSGIVDVSPSGRLRRNGRDAHKAVDSMRNVLETLRANLPDVPVSGGLVFVDNQNEARLPAKLDDVGLCPIEDVLNVLRRKPKSLSPKDLDATRATVASLLPAFGCAALERPEPVDAMVLDLDAVGAIAEQPTDRRYRFYVSKLWSRQGMHRIYLNTVAGQRLGWTDKRSEEIQLEPGAHSDVEPLLRRLTDPARPPDPDVSVILPAGRLASRVLRSFGNDRRGVGHVVATVWKKGTKRRLYVTLHVAGHPNVDIGWIDLSTGREHANDPARAGLLTQTWHEVFASVTT